MKNALLIIIVLLIIPFQSSLVNSISLWGVKPDIIFIFVYAIGLTYNEEKAMLMGAGLGLAADIFSGGPLGMNFLSKAATGFAAGALGRRILNMQLRLQILVIFFVTMLEVMLQITLLSVFSKGIMFSVGIKVIFLQALYNSLFTFVFLWPLIKKLKREREWLLSAKESILIR